MSVTTCYTNKSQGGVSKYSAGRLLLDKMVFKKTPWGLFEGGAIKHFQPYPGGLFEQGVYSSRGSVRIFRVLNYRETKPNVRLTDFNIIFRQF